MGDLGRILPRFGHLGSAPAGARKGNPNSLFPLPADGPSDLTRSSATPAARDAKTPAPALARVGKRKGFGGSDSGSDLSRAERGSPHELSVSLRRGPGLRVGKIPDPGILRRDRSALAPHRPWGSLRDHPSPASEPARCRLQLAPQVFGRGTNRSGPGVRKAVVFRGGSGPYRKRLGFRAAPQ